MLGHGDTGIVARLNDDAMQQIVDRDLRVDLDEHPRAAGTPGLLAHRDHVAVADLTLLDFQGGDVGGHQLGQARWRQALVTVVLDQYLAAGRVHQHVGLGRQLRGGRYDLRCPDGRGDRQHCQDYEALHEAGDVHPNLKLVR